jgi:glutaminyl-tRNA synthetase
MCVLRPLKVVITNYPEGQVENLELPRHPKEDMGVRVRCRSPEIYIDRDDFMEEPPRATSAWSRTAKCACAAAT